MFKCRVKKGGKFIILTNNKTNQGCKHKGKTIEVRQTCYNVHNKILMEIYIKSHF